MTQHDIADLVRALTSDPRLGRDVVHHELLPGQEASYRSPSEAWPQQIDRVLEGLGIHRLYAHQARALDAVRAGSHTVVATPTASGKSLIYNLPVLERFALDSSSRSLYLFPLKALAQDQQRGFRDLLTHWPGRPVPSCAVYDGDTPRGQRSRIRSSPPTVLMSNPEMLHLSVLAYHHAWRTLLANLDYVVVDEVHTYRGVMGSNMAWVFRRLLRLCSFYGARPTFIFCSATIGNPAELASRLTGLEVGEITESGAPRGRRHMLFMNPGSGAASSCAQSILQQALPRELRTIVYSQSRKMTELLALWAAKKSGELGRRISAYRSGFLPRERREIETKLSRGDLLAVISTSALELGIDIGALDLCVLLGYPGSIMAAWQRGGRVGRQSQDSAIVLIGHEDSLDQYFMHNPQEFFRIPPEKAVINPENPVIMRRHLQCAAADLPLDPAEPLAGSGPVREALESLQREGLLVANGGGDRYFAANRAVHLEVELRGAGRQMDIVDERTGRTIGSVDIYRAHRETHPGAVYLHRGTTYIVTGFRPEEGVICARAEGVDYFTRVRTEKHTEILETRFSRTVGSARLSLGRIRVTERVTGYEHRLARGQKLLTVVPLELEPLVFETQGFWLQIPQQAQEEAERCRLHFMGGIHALEHAMIGIMPLLVLTDRNDLGGISQPAHPQLSGAAVFVYDGIPGGVGLAEQAFPIADELLHRTREAIVSCECELGCPACVHSPKCGSGNRPLDKRAALLLLDAISRGMQRRPSPEGRQRPGAGQAAGESSAATVPLQPKPAGPPRTGRAGEVTRYGVLDLETQRSASEVGGWHRADRMGVSCAVLFDGEEGEYCVYRETELASLIRRLRELDLVVGFNLVRFDYRVLAPYSDVALDGLPTLDILLEIHRRLGYRLSLDNLAGATLGARKTGSGMQALEWWRQGEIDRIAEYCRADVRLTRDLFRFGRGNGYLLFRNKASRLVRLPVQW
jgi:DEAD/DEAH box helicase domain-containing protein